MLNKFTNFLLELFFPKFCFGCRKEGNYLCPDCRSTLEISGSHKINSIQNLKDLYCPLDYRNLLLKNLIQKFKYEPFVKEMSPDLSSLIIEHFQLLDNKPNFSEFLLIPVPLEKRKLKWRGFNQAEEIAKELSSFWKIPLISGCLIKNKKTIPQVELTAEARKENIKRTFLVRNETLVKNKKILLVDDVYTTGSTMEEAAKVLKEAGAKEIIGIAVSRAKPGEDRLQNV